MHNQSRLLTNSKVEQEQQQNDEDWDSTFFPFLRKKIEAVIQSDFERIRFSQKVKNTTFPIHFYRVLFNLFTL